MSSECFAATKACLLELSLIDCTLCPKSLFESDARRGCVNDKCVCSKQVPTIEAVRGDLIKAYVADKTYWEML